MLTWIILDCSDLTTIGFEHFCTECASLVPPMQFSVLETPLTTDAVFQIPFTFMHNLQNSCSIIHFRNSFARSALLFSYRHAALMSLAAPIDAPVYCFCYIDTASPDAISRRPSSTSPSNHYCPQPASSITPASNRHPVQPAQLLSRPHTTGRPSFPSAFSDSLTSSHHSRPHSLPHLFVRLGASCSHQTCTTATSSFPSILGFFFITATATTQAQTATSTTPQRRCGLGCLGR